jgi:DNA transposition AAA+ family ATPase
MIKENTPFTLRKNFVKCPHSVRALARIKEVHEASRVSGKGMGVAILGPSGVGKTTVLTEYCRSHFGASPGVGSKPILFVEVPSTPTPKSLGTAVLAAMGDQFAHRGSAEEKLFRIVKLLAGLKTELIIFDEAQHLVERRRTPTGATTDWMKNLLNASKVAVVLAGLKRTQDLLLSNEQLRRRFSATVYCDRFNVDDARNTRMFAQLLVSFQRILPVPTLEFASSDTLLRFYHASYGLIDYLIKVIDRAVYLVQAERFAEIDLPVLAQAFRDEVWSLAPDDRNPFCSEFNNVELTGKFEPFEDFDVKAA